MNDSANDIPPQQSQSQSESQSPSQSPSPAPAPAPTSSSSPSVSQSEKKVGERKSKKLLNSKLAESVQAQENEKYAGSEKNNNSPALAQPESVSSKESEIQTPTRSRKRKPKKKVTESELTELTELTELLTESDNTILVGENNELATVEELKKKKVIDQDFSIYDSEVNLSRNQRQRLKQTSPTGAEHITPTPGIINDSVDSITETPISSCSTIAAKTPISFTTPVKRPETTPIKNHSVVGTATPENPFAINLRSTKTTISNGKFAENLPEIHPIKTIIGLNHKQVLNLSLSDVKIKAIISSSLTAKFVANILKFALKHSHSIFSDVEVRAKFIKLCINVALYESVGFKKTSKEFDVEELFGCYPEITLETTGTKLTPPTEKFHQNQFDYSVLSFIGHVLIWAYSLQLQAGLPTFFEKYDLDIDQKEIRKNIGGDHLWDRLNRSLGSLNTKRWKHISKFRDSFGFYEDQFMLILRFLNVDDTIP